MQGLVSSWLLIDIAYSALHIEGDGFNPEVRQQYISYYGLNRFSSTLYIQMLLSVHTIKVNRMKRNQQTPYSNNINTFVITSYYTNPSEIYLFYCDCLCLSKVRSDERNGMSLYCTAILQSHNIHGGILHTKLFEKSISSNLW